MTSTPKRAAPPIWKVVRLLAGSVNTGDGGTGVAPASASTVYCALTGWLPVLAISTKVCALAGPPSSPPATSHRDAVVVLPADPCDS